jgi:DNA processing protein
VACSDCRARAALIAALAPASVPASERVPTALCAHEPSYPQRLRQLDCAPAVLYATCTAERLGELLAKPVIAIVGSRTPSEYAHQMATKLARGLVSAGVTLIGDCDGLLHESIVAQGAAISELPPGFSATQQWCFTASQRMIAALAGLVVVIEAPRRSAALLIAQLASDLGRELAVVPGRVTDAGAPGMFGLLRDGAFPVSCAEDVLELIPMVHTTEHRAQRIAA